ncbi:MAG: PQQ-binding-like beta-propeller repeat protein [Kofleriaceae bacterium]|nr:PQQ-binding-like beta-propeller repeat protein [Kofleriaceae bacterium]
MSARALAAGFLLATSFAITLSTAVARGDDVIAPPDRHVTCLDQDTGAARWEVTPTRLGPAALAIVDGRLVVTEVGQARPARHVLDLQTGAPSTRPIATRAAVTSAVRFDRARRWRGHDLTGPIAAPLRVPSPSGGPARRLVRWPDELAVVGDVAIFTLAGAAADAWQGQVFGYDLRRRKVVWRTSVVPPGLVLQDGRRTAFFDHGYTGVWADADAVYVMFDQALTALSPTTGRPRWRQELPRQALRRYDVARMRLHRLADRLVVALYEDLFVIDAATGALRWAFDSGQAVDPEPVLGAGLACLTLRRDPAVTVGHTTGIHLQAPTATQGRP